MVIYWVLGGTWGAEPAGKRRTVTRSGGRTEAWVSLGARVWSGCRAVGARSRLAVRDVGPVVGAMASLGAVAGLKHESFTRSVRSPAAQPRKSDSGKPQYLPCSHGVRARAGSSGWDSTLAAPMRKQQCLARGTTARALQAASFGEVRGSAFCCS